MPDCQIDTGELSLYVTDRSHRFFMIPTLLVILTSLPFMLVITIDHNVGFLGLLFSILALWPALVVGEEVFEVSSIALCIGSQQIIARRLLKKSRVVDLHDVRKISLGKSRSRLHATLTVETQGRNLTTAVEYTLDLVEWARAVVAVGEEDEFRIVADVDRPTWHPRPAGDRGTYTFVDSRSDL